MAASLITGRSRLPRVGDEGGLSRGACFNKADFQPALQCKCFWEHPGWARSSQLEGIKTLGRDVSLSVSSLSLMAKTSFSKSILWLAVFRIYIIRKTTVPYRRTV